MIKYRWIIRVLKLALCLVPGTALIGSSCATDIKDNFVGAGLDFVKSSSSQSLQTIFPIKDILNGILHPPQPTT